MKVIVFPAGTEISVNFVCRSRTRLVECVRRLISVVVVKCWRRCLFFSSGQSTMLLIDVSKTTIYSNRN